MQKRIFISFAIEDEYARNYLVGQARNNNSPFEFYDMSVKQPWDNSWKTNCRKKIKGCDGLIALLSRNTLNADGAKWEIKCAQEESIPILGIHIQKDDNSIPYEIIGEQIVYWDWNNIANFINSL